MSQAKRVIHPNILSISPQPTSSPRSRSEPTSGVFASGLCLRENKLGLSSDLLHQLAKSLDLLLTKTQILGVDLLSNPELIIQRCQLIFDVHLAFAHMDAPGHPSHALGILSQLN